MSSFLKDYYFKNFPPYLCKESVNYFGRIFLWKFSFYWLKAVFPLCWPRKFFSWQREKQPILEEYYYEIFVFVELGKFALFVSLGKSELFRVSVIRELFLLIDLRKLFFVVSLGKFFLFLNLRKSEWFYRNIINELFTFLKQGKMVFSWFSLLLWPWLLFTSVFL